MLSTDYKFVVAFDIGTTYSAYAYAEKDFKNNQIKITCNKQWNSGQYNLTTMKTPTSVLLDKDGELMEFGYKAENKYAELVEEGARDFYLFRRFKLDLYKNTPTSKMELADENGRKLLAKTVFAKAISGLMKEFEESIDTSGIHLIRDEVRWVITVPAIWSEAAKQFMRNCAYLFTSLLKYWYTILSS
ncbi:Hypothetical predicted protein [Mytilus galloprovincialis]|uniref:Uncharacterized protein n=1 Tax=Mytilus galloprovincialis TaxID=29158 RepID=A0A8B6HF34_MYTGA|nr:Hypothetical predicted protein [Mytilus galloprovincialis]